MLKEFREFISRGNVIDMAIGIIIGAAFGTIVSSFVRDVIMPPIGLALGGVDFTNLFAVLRHGSPPGPYATLADAQAASAVTLNYGVFINTIVIFLIVAVAVFLLIFWFNRIRRRFEATKALAEPATKDCPYCFSKIPIKATRCPNCTSQLETA